MMTVQTAILGLVTPLGILGLVSCGNNAGAGSPSISGLSDQTLIQNTLPGEAALSLPFAVSDGQDPASALSVTTEVLGGVTAQVSCDEEGACELAISLARSQAASAAVTVTVQDTEGNKADSSLNIVVAPRLVKSAADSGTASLRETIAEAEAGDVIAFDTSGDFASAQTIRLESDQLTLAKVLSIEGPGADKLTLDGAAAHRIFNAKGENVSLSGMTLRNGLGQDGNASSLSNSIGGALVNRDLLTLKDMVISGNTAELGGAIYNAKGAELHLQNVILGGESANEATRSGGAIFNEGELSIKASTLSANKAGRYGGALYNHEKDTAVTIESSKLIGNLAQSSSAVVNGFLVCNVDCESRAGSLTIRDSEISNNRSVPLALEDEDRVEGSNGALSNFGPLEIYSSRFEANESPSGSALYNHFLAVTILDKTVFSDNVSSFNAGAIYNEGTLTLRNGTTVMNNAAVNSGGGLFNEQGQVSIGAGNSVSGNRADSDRDDAGTGGGVYSLGGSTDIAQGVVSGNTPNDVVLDAPASRSLRLDGISHRP